MSVFLPLMVAASGPGTVKSMTAIIDQVPKASEDKFKVKGLNH